MIITDVETTAACCSSDLLVLRCRIERVGYVNVGGVSSGGQTGEWALVQEEQMGPLLIPGKISLNR